MTAFRLSWLPQGFSFLSGLPEAARKVRHLMPVQVFADESIGKHFVMAGLIAESEAWSEFSDEWRAALKHPPSLGYFKMREPAGQPPRGEFFGLSYLERDKKLRVLARIINRYARIYTQSVIDLKAFSEVWKGRFSHTNDPYFWPFQNTILASGYTIFDLGIRDRFEIIFDEHLILGPRAKIWYPVLREFVRDREPTLYMVLPIDPLFRKDDDFLPLQAADMFAWCTRREADGEDNTFDWLLPEFTNIMRSEYSQYFDADRMRAAIELSDQQLREGNIDRELIKKYQETHKLIYGRAPRR
jgi:hypothetical protein